MKTYTVSWSEKHSIDVKAEDDTKAVEKVQDMLRSKVENDPSYEIIVSPLHGKRTESGS